MGFLDEVHQLQEEYKAIADKWYTKLFFPSSLKKALSVEANSSGSAWPIVKAFQNHTWFFRQRFFPCIHKFSNTSLIQTCNIARTVGLLKGEEARENVDAIVRHNNTEGSLVYALNVLRQTGLLTGEAAQANFKALLDQENPECIAGVIETLNRSGLLTDEVVQANVSAIVKHNNPRALASALETVELAKLLTGGAGQANVAAIVKHNNPGALVSALATVDRAGLLTEDTAQANIDAILAHDDPSVVAGVISMVHGMDCLTGKEAQEIIDAILAHNKPKDVDTALRVISGIDLLTANKVRAIVKHTDPGALVRALIYVRQANLLTGKAAQENFEVIVEHNNPEAVGGALAIVHQANLLTGEAAKNNRTKIVEHDNPGGLAFALATLHRTALLTQQNFAALIGHQDILLSARTAALWSRIPPHMIITNDQWNDMLRICRRGDSVNARRGVFIRYFNENILQVTRERRQVINPGQSTHTDSVNQSASESASNLSQLYGNHADLESVINNMKSYFGKLKEDNVKIAAATRCLERITENCYYYTDQASNVSTRQLLAYAWLAIDDDKKRSGTREDAIAHLTEGLYEIQRGYNLSENGADDNQQDRPICVAGTFNKLIEALSTFHPDCKIQYVTKELATLKLPIVVREEARNYLAEHADPETSEAFCEFNQLVAKLKENGIDAIWELIKASVSDRMFEEFGSLYEKGKASREFKQLVESGQYVTDLGNLDDFQKQIGGSEGYREYCSQVLQHFSFFSSGINDGQVHDDSAQHCPG